MPEFINTADIIGDDEMCDQIIMRTVTEYKENRISKVGQYAFHDCTELTVVDVPNATVIGKEAFQGCGKMQRFFAPKVKRIESYENPLPTNWQFTEDAKNAIYDFGSLNYIGIDGLRNVYFNAMIFRSPTIIRLQHSNSFGWNNARPLGNGAYVYVPRALLSDDDETMDYRRATNWSNYANYYRAIEDYTNDGTVTGSFFWCTGVELDKTSLTFDEWKAQTLTATMLTPSPHGWDVVEWKSADESIAVVANGVVRPVSKGTTTITASCNGYSATCEVVVNAEGMNVLAGVAFNAGYISNNGSITAGGTSDVYTDKFSILPLVGNALTITLLDAKSTATNSRIVYYNDSGAVKGYTQGSSIGTDGIVITSTVPSDATLAAISINKSNGFSGIEITSDGVIVGSLDYTA